MEELDCYLLDRGQQVEALDYRQYYIYSIGNHVDELNCYLLDGGLLYMCGLYCILIAITVDTVEANS